MNSNGFSRSTLTAAVAVTVVVVAAAWLWIPYTASDSGAYRQMAEGQTVLRPFANRVLAPWLAARIADLAGCSLDTAFRGLGMAAVLLFTTCVAALLPAARRRWILPAALLATPFTVLLFRAYYLPDLPHAALTAAILVALGRRSLLVLPLFLLAGLVRESTLLLAVVAGGWAWSQGRRGFGLGVAGAAAAGVAGAWLWSGGAGLGNAHGIGPLAYFAFKVPFNLMGNLFGLELWANTLPLEDPVWTWELPAALARGSVTSVGIWRWNPLRPLYLAQVVLTTFGVVPTLLLFARRRGARLLSRSRPELATAMLYGLTVVFLVPITGSAVERLFSYAWPALLVAAPWLLFDPQAVPAAPGLRRGLLGLHLTCAWLAALARLMPTTLGPVLLILVLAAICHVAAQRLLVWSSPLPRT